MIYLENITAFAKCDEEAGCTRTAPVKLVLGLMGGIMFEPPEEPDWQLIVASRPGQPVQLRCPAHNRKVDTAGMKAVPFRKV